MRASGQSSAQRSGAESAERGRASHVCGGKEMEGGWGRFKVRDRSVKMDSPWLINPSEYLTFADHRVGNLHKYMWGYQCGGAIGPCNQDDPRLCDEFLKNPSVWPGWSRLRLPQYTSSAIHALANAFYQIVKLKRTVALMKERDALAAQIALRLHNYDNEMAADYIAQLRAGRGFCPRWRDFGRSPGGFLEQKYWDVIRHPHLRTESWRRRRGCSPPARRRSRAPSTRSCRSGSGSSPTCARTTRATTTTSTSRSWTLRTGRMWTRTLRTGGCGPSFSVTGRGRRRGGAGGGRRGSAGGGARGRREGKGTWLRTRARSG